MLASWFILVASIGYLSILFAIAYYGDKRADQGRSIIANPYIYALSIAVYCTSWTFYGSVGRAASSGMDFLAIYVGPTLAFLLWWFVLRKIIRISKANRITSIADFIASRYGKSTLLGGLVTVIAVISITPYIALQLKAVSTSFGLVLRYPDLTAPAVTSLPFHLDTGLIVALALAVFAILFGTRHIDASEHHEGMVAAVAFESIVKLVAFLAVGIFVTFGLYDGFGDLFARAASKPELARLFIFADGGAYGQWMTLVILSMAAILCLPRQFQVTVVENVDERHLRKAAWLFPLYLLVINIFVLPIAVGGMLQFPGGKIEADTFVLALPMAHRMEALTLLVYIGGLSAATAMVIVATIALSTMACNDLVMPVLLRIRRLRLTDRGDLPGLLLAIRRGSILVIVMLGYLYYRTISESYTLVTIGLLSFTAAAQFAPSIIGGIFWSGATRRGALWGLSLGFVVWLYTLLLPSFARSGWLPTEFVEHGPLGMAVLKPYALFGLDSLDYLSHSLFWSMLANLGAFILVSVSGRQDALERIQSVLFVDVDRRAGPGGDSHFWRGTAEVKDLRGLVARFIGRKRTDRAFLDYGNRRHVNISKMTEADPSLVNYAERLLAGAIGAASARIMVGTVVKGEVISVDEVMKILDETSQAIEYSRQLEEKSAQIERASQELRAANERLKELDRLKDDFLSIVSHELRTPLTSIRSFSEILSDNPQISSARRQEFLGVIIRESERLTRLITQILDLAKMEAGRMDWRMSDVDPKAAIEDALAASSGLFGDKPVALDVDLPGRLPPVRADRDRLVQVVVNLLSNAIRHCDGRRGRVTLMAEAVGGYLLVSITDNGPGVPRREREVIFERFRQGAELAAERFGGTGLGLSIARQIVLHFGGRIWVENVAGSGARFCFTIPLQRAGEVPAAAQ